MGRANAIGAGLIGLTTLVAVWGAWRLVAIVVIGQISTTAFNVWFNHAVLGRSGPRSQLMRAAVNSGMTTLMSALVGWPAPCWLWPPYTALVFDRSERHASAIVGAAVVVQGVAALACGVPWIHPLSALVLTGFAWRISAIRVQTIGDMLVRSDEQRAEIAHAHDQLKAEIAMRERVELELRAAQKLEALGRIASGVAHEINTPIQFVGDSVGFLQAGVEDILSLCQLNHSVRVAPDAAARALAIAAADDAERAADLPYLVEHLPQALARARDGVDRVALIVRSMKQFAHDGAVGSAHVDLDQAVEATLAIAAHEYKLVADVETVLGGLPPVLCRAGEINQVLLNIVVNAAHAIAAAVAGTDARGTIRVTTARDGHDVVISIADTGTGIPPAVAERMFEPFFTTKEVGRGTGQGLAIARAIVERHHGRLSFESEPGRGTTFHLRLPIDGTPARAAHEAAGAGAGPHASA